LDIFFFCVRPFALHRQQSEKGKQNVDFVLTLEKFLRTPMCIAVLQIVCWSFVMFMLFSLLMANNITWLAR